MKAKKKKIKSGGPPKLGLGPRWSIALFIEQERALRAVMKKTNRERVEILREHLTKYPIQ